MEPDLPCQCQTCQARFLESEATQWGGQVAIFCPRCGSPVTHCAPPNGHIAARSRWAKAAPVRETADV